MEAGQSNEDQVKTDDHNSLKNDFYVDVGDVKVVKIDNLLLKVSLFKKK